MDSESRDNTKPLRNPSKKYAAGWERIFGKKGKESCSNPQETDSSSESSQKTNQDSSGQSVPPKSTE